MYIFLRWSLSQILCHQKLYKEDEMSRSKSYNKWVTLQSNLLKKNSKIVLMYIAWVSPLVETWLFCIPINDKSTFEIFLKHLNSIYKPYCILITQQRYSIIILFHPYKKYQMNKVVLWINTIVLILNIDLSRSKYCKYIIRMSFFNWFYDKY